MKYLVVILLFVTLTPVYIQAHQANQVSSFSTEQKRVMTNLFDQLMKRQVNSAIAVERSVSSLIKNYPEKINLILAVAIHKYPHEYKQIICGTLRAEPALTSDVIEVILNSDIANISEIISIAVTEEPAYANEIVSTVANHQPDDIENIVRVAITTEPVIAQSVVGKTMSSYPEKLLDIISVAIKALPNQVANIVSDAIKLFPDDADAVVSTAVSPTKGKQSREIIESAIKSGISKEQATAAAIAGGANSNDIAKIDH